ncbi:MAG: hypothetical protein JEZ08_09175 [Clostridiales bacterium]|nr:hypothetical protein [Clostridiales bacterium]
MKSIDHFFEQFDEIYNNKEQYNISWAFRDAQEKLNGFKEEVVDEQIKKKCLLCKNKDNSAYSLFQEKSYLAIKRQRLIANVFENAHTLITILEFILSVILVMVVSEISHSDTLVIESRLFSMWVVIIFAFFKVIIEQFLLRPKMEAFGWKLYANSVDLLRNLTLELSQKMDINLNDLPEII